MTTQQRTGDTQAPEQNVTPRRVHHDGVNAAGQAPPAELVSGASLQEQLAYILQSAKCNASNVYYVLRN